jgi:hypothetical protein
MSQLPAAVTFRITTNNGNAFSTATPTVELRGDGWIDVREVFLNGAPEPVALTWTDGDSWRFNAPLLPGANTLSLTARNHQGSVVGSASIDVTNTSVIEPARASNIAIGELMYDPGGAGAEEYLEIVNISAVASVDLSGAAFTEGIDFVFPASTVLAPGARLLLVQDAAAFAARYGAGNPVAGVFANGSRLNNGGERLRLTALGGEVIRDFSYNNSAPWPVAAAGAGHSLVLIAPTADPDHGDPFNWRASAAPGGTPGGSDATEFTGDPDGDDNGDGLSNLMNYALGPNGTGPAVAIESGGQLAVAYSRNVAADDLLWFLDLSDDLASWRPGAGQFVLASESTPLDGLTTVVLRSVLPIDPTTPEQFIRVRVEKR